MYQFYFILFWSDTVHVSDGLFVHHQEFKTVHTAIGTYQTDTAATACWQVDSSVCFTNACCCMYSLELLMMDEKSVRNM